MSREIKFRVWSIKEKVFLKLQENGFSGEYGRSLMYCVLNPQDYTVQQYTGLKDIDNREIYEGDILKSLHRTYCQYVEVKYDQYDAAFKTEDRFMREFMQLNEMIIVGNVFQNPELLK